ncbi:MAG: hypothetical protein AB7G37_09900 [Solirubrobacteraceae bacterium]
MARRSLRPQLNQIRTWVRQGRTDAWIAHQLEVTGQEIADFKAKNDLAAAGPDTGSAVAPEEVDLRAEDDALIAAELEAAEEARKAEEARQAAEEEARKAEEARQAAERAAAGDDESDEDDEDDDRPRRRRRGGRRRRRGGSSNTVFEGTFDHGDEGYGLWLDPAVADSGLYAEHWAGHRPVEVTIEADQIVIRRVGDDDGNDND